MTRAETEFMLEQLGRIEHNQKIAEDELDYQSKVVFKTALNAVNILLWVRLTFALQIFLFAMAMVIWGK